MIWFFSSAILVMGCEAAWTTVFTRLIPFQKSRTPFATRMRRSFQCLVGSFSPANAASEALRARMNRLHEGIPYVDTWAASTYASLLKLRTALAISAGLLWASDRRVAALALAIAFLSFLPTRVGFGRRWTASAPKAVALESVACFTASFACEALAFAACMRGLSIDFPQRWIPAFSMIHLAGRVPFLPQGLLLSEATGYLALSKTLGSERALLLMAAWAAIRAGSPMLLGALCFRSNDWRMRALHPG